MTFASWKKCDFQVHSCRDPNWAGARPVGVGEALPGTGQAATLEDVENARREWAHEFVDTCVSKGLQAIALTDHHETIMLPYVRAAISLHNAATPEKALWFFPGMELTVKGGSQCLILFDHDVSDDWLRQAQGRLGIAFAAADETASKGTKVVQLSATYAEIADQLNVLEPLRKKFILLPNVSQSGAHTVLADGAHADFLKMGCAGGYLDRGKTYADYSEKNKTRLSGRDAMWSKREVYSLQTSDCRSADRAALGTNDTWIKLEAPTAEAIRQAFLAHRSRIRTSAPEIPAVFVSAVSIEGSVILKDVSVQLSPEQNSIIGGRGSGKSSLLEYIAFGLGRSASDLVERESYSGNQRLVELVTDTLKAKNGKVRLSISQDGALFQVVRGPETAYQPQITYPKGAPQVVSTKDLRSLFPAVVYSQGELAELGKLTASKADLTDLLQFVNPEYKKEDDLLLSNLEGAKRDVRLAVERQVEAWTLAAEIRKLGATRDSLKERIAALEKTLPALSPDDQKAVDQYEAASQFESHREQASKHALAFGADIEELIQTQADARDVTGSDTDEAKAFGDAYLRLHKTFVDGTAKLKADLASDQLALQRAEEAWTSRYAAARKARDEVLQKLGHHKAATGQIIKLKEELVSVVAQIGDQETKLKSFGDPSVVLASKVTKLREHTQKRSERTQTWAAEIQALSSGKIVASVLPEGNISEIREALDTVGSKTGSQEATRLREVDTSIAGMGVWALIDRLRIDTLALIHWRQLGSTDSGDAPSAPDLFRILGTSDKAKATLIELIDASRLSAVATAVPKPLIELSYSDGNRKIAFEKASEGQRAAALLFMLLEQPGGPLIIDQPEGDLDNSIITELTDKLHLAKQKRQLIFASHNANIVVNGSSELVAHLNVDGAGMREFEAVGSIDSLQVQDVITRTMEGGKKAFLDRKEKYGF